MKKYLEKEIEEDILEGFNMAYDNFLSNEEFPVNNRKANLLQEIRGDDYYLYISIEDLDNSLLISIQDAGDKSVCLLRRASPIFVGDIKRGILSIGVEYYVDIKNLDGINYESIKEAVELGLRKVNEIKSGVDSSIVWAMTNRVEKMRSLGWIPSGNRIFNIFIENFLEGEASRESVELRYSLYEKTIDKNNKVIPYRLGGLEHIKELILEGKFMNTVPFQDKEEVTKPILDIYSDPTLEDIIEIIDRIYTEV